MKVDHGSMSCTGKKAGTYFQSGYHCAEAVAAAILESQGIDSSQAVAHATPFGGGIGKSHCETCGAITGGLIAIGHFHGRTQRGENWDTPARMGKELREQFIQAYGETGCGILRERFGENQMDECARVVENITEATIAILATDTNLS